MGVSESSIKRWCDQGTLPASRTPGGHRRIAIEAAVAFARQSGRPIARPELLGIPTSRRSAVLSELLPLFTRELLDGNEQSLREMTYDLFIQQHSLANIFDEVMRPSLATIARGCADKSVKQFELRRGLSITSSVLTELRSELGSIPTTGPVACGGTIDFESIGICSKMTELILRSEGWNTFSFGGQCPASIIFEAGHSMKPDLIWMGTSSRRGKEEFKEEAKRLAIEMSQLGVPVFIGAPFADEMVGLPGKLLVSNSLSAFTDFLGQLRTQGGSQPR